MFPDLAGRAAPSKRRSPETFTLGCPSARKRSGMSPAQRKAVGVRMKAYWAKRRGEKARTAAADTPSASDAAASSTKQPLQAQAHVACCPESPGRADAGVLGVEASWKQGPFPRWGRSEAYYALAQSSQRRAQEVRFLLGSSLRRSDKRKPTIQRQSSAVLTQRTEASAWSSRASRVQKG